MVETTALRELLLAGKVESVGVDPFHEVPEWWTPPIPVREWLEGALGSVRLSDEFQEEGPIAFQDLEDVQIAGRSYNVRAFRVENVPAPGPRPPGILLQLRE